MPRQLLNLTFSFYLLLNAPANFAADLWVDAVNGNDSQDGLTTTTALRSLQAAAIAAVPGTTVHIQPGVYRETIKPVLSGAAPAPIIYRAEQGVGSVIIRGSEVVQWTPLTENVIGLPPQVDPNQLVWADLSAWGLSGPPRFVMQLDAAGNVIARLPLAREPDWQVSTEWKYHEFWWAADGGFEVADCDPPSVPEPAQCNDKSSRSLTQLLDQRDDSAPAGIEPGNLTTLGDLTGATLVAMDTFQGDYLFRRTIVAHEVNLGRITVDRVAERNSANNEGLGWGSKYYVENHPALLDSPGEYWFDSATGRLYLWPLNSDLQYLEISRRDQGWDLSGLSYLILDGLVLEFFNDPAVQIQNTDQQSSYGNQLHNLQVRYAKQGLLVQQVLTAASPPDRVVRDLVLDNSAIGYMDHEAIYLNSWWDNAADPVLFTQAPIANTLIKNNELHHLGLRSSPEESAGLEFRFADQLRFEDNHVHHVLQHGIRLSESVIQAEKSFGFAPDEIKTGDILLKNNLIEYTCQSSGDCGAVTFLGTPPQKHVFRNVLVVGNTFRYNYGWSYVAQQRRRWANGYFGFGLYLVDVSGIHAYRNLAYNNGWSGFFITRNWRDGEMILYNNLSANAARGINIWNPSDSKAHDSVDTQIVNNLIINNETYGIEQSIDPNETQLLIDHNLYYANGWGSNYNAGAMKISEAFYDRLTEVQTQTPWEAHGVSEAPAFFSYDYRAQRQRGDKSVLDFELKRESAALDQGTTTLPVSLQNLLNQFNIEDLPQQGTAWDIGPLEYFEDHQPIPGQGLAEEATTQQFLETATQFTGFATTGFVTTSLGQRGNGLTISQAERVKIIAKIEAESEDIGQLVELGMVAAYTPLGSQEILYFMRQGTTWVPWDGLLTTLAAAEIDSSLPDQFELFKPIEIAVYEGDFNHLPGHFVIYVGYSLPNGIVVFNGQNPIQLTVQ